MVLDAPAARGDVTRTTRCLATHIARRCLCARIEAWDELSGDLATPSKPEAHLGSPDAAVAEAASRAREARTRRRSSSGEPPQRCLAPDGAGRGNSDRRPCRRSPRRCTCRRSVDRIRRQPDQCEALEVVVDSFAEPATGLHTATEEVREEGRGSQHIFVLDVAETPTTTREELRLIRTRPWVGDVAATYQIDVEILPPRIGISEEQMRLAA